MTAATQIRTGSGPDLAYQGRMRDALEQLRRIVALGGAVESSCDVVAKAWRIGYSDLLAAYRGRSE